MKLINIENCTSNYMNFVFFLLKDIFICKRGIIFFFLFIVYFVWVGYLSMCSCRFERVW